jgi:DNA-directed RNA polymerase specialized sigma24 family protein
MYFPTTHWSLLAKASLTGETAALNALGELCRHYWLPLNQFIRSRGYGETEAQDLTQEFLLHLMTGPALQRPDRLKGKFRSFLLGALVHFLHDERDRRLAQKRGGSVPHESLEEETVASTGDSDGSAILFDREWALAILENALNQVRIELGTGDAPRKFEVLQHFLPGALEVPTYESAAEQTGLSLAALKSEVHRLRQRFRALVRQEIAGTVSAPHEIDEELAYLQSILMDKGSDLAAAAKPLPPLS